MITDRLRWSVIEANTGRILARDLVVMQPQVVRNLSAPAQMQFKVTQGESDASAFGVDFKPMGQHVIAEIEVDGVRKIFADCYITNTTVDAQSGDMQIQATGFMGYGKGIPWLENFNPIAVDPFELAQRIWAHLESFSNAQLNCQPLPASSGTQMIPGYSYDGSTLSFNFYAVFIRAVDFNDCYDYLTALARDIPFDIIEVSEWDSDRTKVTRTLQLGYPEGGVQQDYLSFRLGENVIVATQADDLDIGSTSDIIIRSYEPGKVISSQLTNADPTCLRRTVMEEDAFIESDERAAALAKRKLTRRNIPTSFKKIVVDPNHPNAPYGQWDVGDSIYIQAENYPWVGNIEQWHRITSINYDESKCLMELDVMVDGAFNYDPIEYLGDGSETPEFDPNLIYNGYFALNLNSWTALHGTWLRDTQVVYQNDFVLDSASVRTDIFTSDGAEFLSSRASVTPGQVLSVMAAVQYENVVSENAESFILRGTTSHDGDDSVGSTYDFGSLTNAQGVSGWNMLETVEWTVPQGINELALHLIVSSAVTAGTAWWSYIRIIPFGVVTPT